MFADNVAVFVSSQDSLEHFYATTQFIQMASEWGLTVSVQKTKAMALGGQLETSDIPCLYIQLSEGSIEVVHNFTYLGTDDGEVKDKVSTHIDPQYLCFLHQCICRLASSRIH